MTTTATDEALSVVILGGGFIGQMHALSVRLAQMGRGEPRLRARLRCLIEMAQAEKTALATAQRFGVEELRLEPWPDIVGNVPCDVFINAGPNSVHADSSAAFARAGAHVFCEKPLAGSADEAWQAFRAVSGAGAKHMCGFVFRFVPAIQHARALIGNGEIGEVLRYRSRFFLDVRQAGGQQNWRFAEKGGGALGDLGSHHIDLARFLVGEVSEIGGFTGAESDNQSGIDDSFAAIGLLESGATAVFEAGRAAAGHTLAGKVEIDGTLGSIAFDMARLNELTVSTGRKGATTSIITGPDHPNSGFFLPVGPQGALPISWRDCFTFQMHHLLSAVANDTRIGPSAATFEDGYRVAEISEALLRSTATRAIEKVVFRGGEA